MCMREMVLNDTVEMMNSEDYKDRFKAEYYQVAIRYKKLKAMLDKWDKGTLEFYPTCPKSTYNMQIKSMTDYIAVLEARAVMEGIDLQSVLLRLLSSAWQVDANTYGKQNQIYVIGHS